MSRLAAFLLVAVAMAGCLGAPSTPGGASDAQPSRSEAVVALIDTGINPYHEAFRDDSPRAQQHPSTYLPGYPEDAEALDLTLDAENLTRAMEADADVWEDVEPGELYWIPGTKIVGAIAFEVFGERPIFSTGHGTMTASRAAANQYSLCPDCRIAAVQGFDSESVQWTVDQPWIDAQSNSWSPIVPAHQADPVQSPGLAEAFADAAARQPTFASAGNGIGGKAGVAGHPSMTRSTSGAEGVISVGGHDNGEVETWSGSVPHVVADVCANWAAVGTSVDAYDTVGGGTSSASPYAAGAATRLILESRRLLDDPGSRDGATLAEGQAPPALADTPSPVADGDLTLDEAKSLLMRTAIKRPVETDHDGEICRTRAPYNTYPIAWQSVPEDVPAYYFVGYGQVSPASLDRALAVLRGEQSMPDRGHSDMQHDLADQVRGTYNDLPS